MYVLNPDKNFFLARSGLDSAMRVWIANRCNQIVKTLEVATER